jgi:hypothetical protein
MGLLMDILNPGTSKDIITANCADRVLYHDWLERQQAEHVSKSGPVIVKVDRAECDRLLKELEARLIYR